MLTKTNTDTIKELTKEKIRIYPQIKVLLGIGAAITILNSYNAFFKPAVDSDYNAQKRDAVNQTLEQLPTEHSNYHSIDVSSIRNHFQDLEKYGFVQSQIKNDLLSTLESDVEKLNDLTDFLESNDLKKSDIPALLDENLENTIISHNNKIKETIYDLRIAAKEQMPYDPLCKQMHAKIGVYTFGLLTLLGGLDALNKKRKRKNIFELQLTRAAGSSDNTELFLSLSQYMKKEPYISLSADREKYETIEYFKSIANMINEFPQIKHEIFKRAQEENINPSHLECVCKNLYHEQKKAQTDDIYQKS